MEWSRDKRRKPENWGGTFIVKQKQTDYSPAALSPTSRDGSISSSRHTQQRCLKCFFYFATHTLTHTLNLQKPVATWLELRNVAASAVVIQQGGMGLVREKEREKWEVGRQWSKKSDWSIRANNYNNKTVKMQSSPQKRQEQAQPSQGQTREGRTLTVTCLESGWVITGSICPSRSRSFHQNWQVIWPWPPEILNCNWICNCHSVRMH